MSSADRRLHPHFMFSVPCQNGSVFCATLANMLCYKLYHLASRRAALHGKSEQQMGRHSSSESAYMSVVLQLLGLTANIKRPPGHGTRAPLGTVRLAQNKMFDLTPSLSCVNANKNIVEERFVHCIFEEVLFIHFSKGLYIESESHELL